MQRYFARIRSVEKDDFSKGYRNSKRKLWLGRFFFLEIIKLEFRTEMLTLILCTKDAMDTKILKAHNKW